MCVCVFVCECVALQPLSAQRWQRESEREHPQVPLPCNVAALSPAVSICSPSLSLLSRAVSASPSLSLSMSFSSTVSTEQQRAARERARERCSPLSPLPLLPPRLSVTQYRSIHKRLCLSVSLSPCLPVYATVSSFVPPLCPPLCSPSPAAASMVGGNSKKLDQTDLSLCESAISA